MKTNLHPFRFFLSVLLVCLMGSVYGSGDSTYTLITSPVNNATFTGPVDIDLSAEVHSNGDVNVFRVSSPDNSWRTIKIGYDPNNIYSPNQNVSAGGNTHLMVTLKQISSGTIDWGNLNIKIDTISLSLNNYLPTGGIDTTWGTISIPLADYTGVDFTTINHIKFISSGASAFTVGFKEITFSGGSSPFVWFGGTKFDNSHDGTDFSNSPPSGSMNADVIQEVGVPVGTVSKVSFYANSLHIGDATQMPYSTTLSGVLSGSFNIYAITTLSDSTTHVSDTVAITVNADTAVSPEVSITSLTDSMHLYEPGPVTLTASVTAISEASYIEVGSPGGWAHLKLGYDPNSLYANPQDVAAGGNTHMEITFRTSTSISASDWGKIGVKISNNRPNFDTYLPGGTAPVDTWTTISIPLTDFGPDNFNSLTNIKIPFSAGAAAFDMDIREVKFTGGTTEFIWFGGSKIDNSHDGAEEGETPQSGQYTFNLNQGADFSSVDFYLDGVQFDSDTSLNASIQKSGLSPGGHTFTIIANYTNGTYKISPNILVNIDPMLLSSPHTFIKGDDLFGTHIPTRDSRLSVDSVLGHTVIVWRDTVMRNIYFAVMDSNQQLISPPAGESSWPVLVHSDTLELGPPAVDVDVTTGNIAIGWGEFEGDYIGAKTWGRVYDKFGVPLSPYQTAPVQLNQSQTCNTGCTGYIDHFDIVFGANNDLYFAFNTYGAATGKPILINKIDVTTGLPYLSQDARDSVSQTYHINWRSLARLSWDPQIGLVVGMNIADNIDSTNLKDSDIEISIWDANLSSRTVYDLTDTTDVGYSNVNLDISTHSGKILATWIQLQHPSTNWVPISSPGDRRVKAQLFEIENGQLNPLTSEVMVDYYATPDSVSFTRALYDGARNHFTVGYVHFKEEKLRRYIKSYQVIENALDTTYQAISYEKSRIAYEHYSEGLDKYGRYLGGIQWYNSQDWSIEPPIIPDHHEITVGGTNWSLDPELIVVSPFEPVNIELGCPTMPRIPASPTSTENYFLSQTLRTEVQTEAEISNLAYADEIQETVAYFDGLGRGTQQAAVQMSPLGRDMISFTEYDPFGRVTKQHLPFTQIGTGIYRSTPEADQQSFYSANFPSYGTTSLFSETDFELSPLNRAVEQGAPGDDWQIVRDGQNISTKAGHTVKNDFRPNLSTIVIDNNVFKWEFNTTSNKYEAPNKYPEGELWVTETTDENNHRVVEYMDKLGRSILKRVEVDDNTSALNYETWASTYFIYNDFGQVAVVIPPEGVKEIQGQSGTATLETTILDTWCFQYVYDERRRVVEKKVPGADWVYLVYDKLDRVILTQDGNQRIESSGTYTKDDWLFTKYDVLGRPIMTGIYDNLGRGYDGRANLQAHVNTLTTLFEGRSTTETGDGTSESIGGYSNQAFPDIFYTTVHSITFYDDYDFNFDGSPDRSYVTESLIPNNQPFYRLKGQVTGVKTRVLDSSSAQWLWTVTFYDKYHREIQTQSDHLHGTDRVTNEINFAGELKKTVTWHQGPNSTSVTSTQSFCYDHTGRLLWVKQQVNSDDKVTVASYGYDELGRQVEKDLHTTYSHPALQSVDYAYNIRGWLTGINQLENGSPTTQAGDGSPDLFSMQISYQDDGLITPGTNEPGVLAQYNGNISAIRWQNALTATQHLNVFDYDRLNRLTKADYAEYDLTQISWTQNIGRYKAEYDYDFNGNMKTLKRWGVNGIGTFGLMDDLTYTYNNGDKSNQLASVSDAALNSPAPNFIDGTNIGDDYSYDDAGNMTYDLNRDFVVQYNHLNKPTLITLSSSNTIEYIYDAAGTKLQQRVNNNGTITITDYINGFHYENNDLKFFAHIEGRVVHESNGTFRYEYNLTDHLGNSRITFADLDNDGNPEIQQANDYYGFGLSMSGLGYTSSAIPNSYLYNGKEIQDELSLNWYDYGARMYDPAIGRWNGADALAEKYSTWSVYNYTLSNPIRFIDPDGNSVANSPAQTFINMINTAWNATPEDDQEYTYVVNNKGTSRGTIDSGGGTSNPEGSSLEPRYPGKISINSSTTPQKFYSHFLSVIQYETALGSNSFTFGNYFRLPVNSNNVTIIGANQQNANLLVTLIGVTPNSVFTLDRSGFNVYGADNTNQNVPVSPTLRDPNVGQITGGRRGISGYSNYWALEGIRFDAISNESIFFTANDFPTLSMLSKGFINSINRGIQDFNFSQRSVSNFNPRGLVRHFSANRFQIFVSFQDGSAMDIPLPGF